MNAIAAVSAAPAAAPSSQRYAKCIEASRRIRWDIDRDVIRGRELDFARKFLPDGLSRVAAAPFLDCADVLLLSQIQGRTYANVFGLVERFIGAKTLEISRDHWFGDQVAFEALVRFTDEELKHQELFRRLERKAAAGMPPGYRFDAQPNEVAHAVLGRSTWAVLGLTLHIELLTLAHYRRSIEPDAGLSDLWKDAFLFHWKEESQHAILDEIEWRREDARLDAAGRDRAVDELIELVGAVDAILMSQASADADYFLVAARRSYALAEAKAIRELLGKAYRWQYIASGVRQTRFAEALESMVAPAQMERVGKALAPILEYADP